MENGEDAKEAEGKCPEADAVINIVYVHVYYYSVGSTGVEFRITGFQWVKPVAEVRAVPASRIKS